jgi:hypothetical protein
MGCHTCGDSAQLKEIVNPECFIQIQIAGVALRRRCRGAEKVERCAVAQGDSVAAFQLNANLCSQ